MKKLKAVWQLMRLEHGVMIFIAILIGALVSLGGGFPSVKNLILVFCTALFLEASTFALNDYYDLEIDKRNKRLDRPLVRGDLKPKTALLIFGILFPLGIICSFFVNLTCFVIALVTAFFAVFYDTCLKKIKVVGNFYIAYTMAIPFVFGGVSVFDGFVLSFAVNPAIYVIACIAFLAGSGREIMKDVQDYVGDSVKGVKSFPRYIGSRWSNIVAGLFFLLAVVLSFLPFFMRVFDVYFLNYYYLFLVLLCDSMLISTSFHLMFKKKPYLGFYRRFSLIAIFIGLIAFLAGVFIHT